MKKFLFVGLILCAFAAHGQTVNYAQQVAQTGTITGPTSIVGPFTSSGWAMASVSISGVYSGLSATFQFNDGSGWYSAFGTRTDASVQETGPSSVSNAARMWDISLFGTTQFRILATAIDGGTANVSVIFHATPVEAAPTVVTAPGSIVQAQGSLPNPNVLQATIVSAPPPLTPTQIGNQLLYRAAMRVYCQTNLSGCAPGL